MKWWLILPLLAAPAIAHADPCEGRLPDRAGQAFAGQDGGDVAPHDVFGHEDAGEGRRGEQDAAGVAEGDGAEQRGAVVDDVELGGGGGQHAVHEDGGRFGGADGLELRPQVVRDAVGLQQVGGAAAE